MLYIGREMNAKHPHCKKFLTDLSHAIFMQHGDDWQQLLKAREAAGLEELPPHAEQVNFISQVVGKTECVAE